jgi:hypothetical protein
MVPVLDAERQHGAARVAVDVKAEQLAPRRRARAGDIVGAVARAAAADFGVGARGLRHALRAAQQHAHAHAAARCAGLRRHIAAGGREPIDDARFPAKQLCSFRGGRGRGWHVVAAARRRAHGALPVERRPFGRGRR